MVPVDTTRSGFEPLQPSLRDALVGFVEAYALSVSAAATQASPQRRSPSQLPGSGETIAHQQQRATLPTTRSRLELPITVTFSHKGQSPNIQAAPPARRELRVFAAAFAPCWRAHVIQQQIEDRTVPANHRRHERQHSRGVDGKQVSIPRGDAADRQYRNHGKAGLSAREPSDPLVAISAHQVLARSLLTIGSLQQSPRCLPHYRIHEQGAIWPDQFSPLRTSGLNVLTVKAAARGWVLCRRRSSHARWRARATRLRLKR